VRPAVRATDGEAEDEMDFVEGVEVESNGEPAAVKAADEDESEIADRDETKDLVRQRAMRVTAEEEEPEALDELAEDALEATHEDAAAQPSARLHAPPGTTRPQAKRGAPAGPVPAAGPSARSEPKRTDGRASGQEQQGIARSIAAKALETAAKAIGPAKPAAKAPSAHAPSKAKPAPAKKARPAGASKPVAKKAAKKPAARKPAKKPARRGKR